MEKGLNARFEVKEVGEDGSFAGYASIFDTPDQGNDVVMRGAFKKTLAEWSAKGAPIPVCFSHDFKSVPIGGVDEAYEDARGLWVKGKLGLEMALARDVHVALKNKWLRGLSFGFDAVQKKVENGIRYLKELKLYEVSHVLFGLHPEALTLAVKADEHAADALASGVPVTHEQLGRALARLLTVEANLRDEDHAKYAVGMDVAKGDDQTVAHEVKDAGPQGGLGAHIPDGDGSSPSPATSPEEKEADKPYGDVAYADPGYQEDGKKRYPVDTEAHVRAAWSYVNQDKNAGQYSSGDLAKVKAKIVAAWKKLIDKDGPPSSGGKADMKRIEFKVAQRQKASRSKRLSDAADAKSDAIDDKDEPTAEDHAAAARAHASATTAAYKVGDTSKADHHTMMARRHARAAKKSGGAKGYASEFETAHALDAMTEAKATLSDVMDRRDDADDADELCELCGYLDSALEEAINETLADFTMSPEEKIADIGEALDEFKDEVLTWAKQAVANDGVRWGSSSNAVPVLMGSAKQLAEHMAKAIDAQPDKTVAVTIKALGGPDAPAGAADQGAETKRDSVEYDVPEDFLASVAQLKQLVQQ